MESERLIFRKYTEAEHELFVELLTDDEVMRYVGNGLLSRDDAEKLWLRLTTEMYPRGEDTIWGVFAKSDDRYVGSASIRPRPPKPHEWEIGYYLRRSEWRKGYGTEIARRLMEFGFNELRLPAVYATVDTDNDASIRVLQKIGMSEVGREFDRQGMYLVYGLQRPARPIRFA